MFKWLRNRIELLKNDKQLALIMLLHIVLIGLHVYEWQVGDIEYYWYLRAGGCGRDCEVLSVNSVGCGKKF